MQIHPQTRATSNTPHHSLSHSCLALHRTGPVKSGAHNSNTITQFVSVVVCPVWSSDSHDPAVCGASSHLPLLLPLLLDKPTRTPRCRVALRPSTALFFCDGDAAAAAVANLSSSSFLLRFAPSSSLAFLSFSFSSFLRCRSRASSCFRNSRSASHAPSAVVYRFSPLVWEFADPAPPQLLTHSCPCQLPGQRTPVARTAPGLCFPSA